MAQILSAWSKGQRPSGAVLHSLCEPGVWRPCSDFTDMLQRLINCCIVIIINENNQCSSSRMVQSITHHQQH